LVEEHQIQAAAEAEKDRIAATAAAAQKQRVAAVTSLAENADRDRAIAAIEASSAAFRKSSSAGQLRNDSGKHSGRRN